MTNPDQSSGDAFGSARITVLWPVPGEAQARLIPDDAQSISLRLFQVEPYEELTGLPGMENLPLDKPSGSPPWPAQTVEITEIPATDIRFDAIAWSGPGASGDLLASGAVAVSIEPEVSPEASPTPVMLDITPKRILFEDDFENADVGIYPGGNGWRNMFSGKSAAVSDTYAHGDERSFCLDSYSDWARYDYIELSEMPDRLSYEASVFIDPTDGQAAVVGFVEAWGNEGPTWNHFRIDGRSGNISFYGGIPVGDYTPGTWCTVRADLDYGRLQADLWLNSRLVVQGAPIAPKEFDDNVWGHTTLDRWGVVATEYTGGSSNVVYIDDVSVEDLTAASAIGGNLVQNGDFTQDLANWIFINNAPQPGIGDNLAFEQNEAAYVHSYQVEDGGEGYLVQDLPYDILPTRFRVDYSEEQDDSYGAVFMGLLGPGGEPFDNERRIHYHVGEDVSAPSYARLSWLSNQQGAELHEFASNNPDFEQGTLEVQFDYEAMLATVILTSNSGTYVRSLAIPSKEALVTRSVYLGAINSTDNGYYIGRFDNVIVKGIRH